jgi:predicted secreted protein
MRKLTMREQRPAGGASLLLGAVFAAAVGIGLAACTPASEESASPDPGAAQAPAQPDPVPAADDEFARAATFECETGGEIEVLFQHGDTPSARIRVGGAVQTLTLTPDPASPDMVYASGPQSLTLRGGDAVYVSQTGETTACRAVNRPLPPPTVEGVVRDLQQADAGAEVVLGIGQRFSVSLSGVPTAGYMWAPQDPPAFLEKVAETGGPTSTAQLHPGFAGGNHWEVTVFEAKAAGDAELTMVQRRPWEDKAEPDAATFKVKVKVQ